MLVYDPAIRISASEALRHPYLSSSAESTAMHPTAARGVITSSGMGLGAHGYYSSGTASASALGVQRMDAVDGSGHMAVGGAVASSASVGGIVAGGAAVAGSAALLNVGDKRRGRSLGGQPRIRYVNISIYCYRVVFP
jgi:hypothetical protein